MAKKAFTFIEEANQIVGSSLNQNFTNLADVINTVDNDQFLREGISWESCAQLISGPNTGALAISYNPVMQRTENSGAKLEGTNTSTVVLTAIGSATNLVDNTAAVFEITLDSTTETPSYSFAVGDAVRYWFQSAILFYDGGGTEATNEYAVIYPQFRVTISGVTGPWLDPYPTPITPYIYSPAAFVGGAIDGAAAVYQTTRTAAGVGRGPGSWRSVAVEGIFPITAANTQKVEIKMVAYGVPTISTDLRIDLSNACMQACLLKNCYDI
jgi:hypothetical protein